MCFMNPPESMLIRKMKSDRRRFLSVRWTMNWGKKEEKEKKNFQFSS